MTAPAGAGASWEEEALARLDPEALAQDLARLVQVPSLTGDERAALELVAELAASRGLESALIEHDLAALASRPGYPGSAVPRRQLFGLSVALPGADPGAPRLCLNGHVDVVPPGPLPWERDPWSGTVEGGRVYGRGSVDMKGGLVAALHALGAARAAAGRLPGDVVLQAVASEEDGGQGTFAALEQDADFAACLIPEPTGLDVVCAHAGSVQFEGVVRGRSAHAALRREGLSALDRYLPLHQALAEHERRLNADVRHPLMRELELPYPIVVGRLEAGRWASQVPDELRFQGRVGVRMEETVEEACAALQALLERTLDREGPPLELRWLGRFRPTETAPSHPLVVLARQAMSEELGRPARVTGVPWGADMQHFGARGIPCVMLGPSGIGRAHAVDEWVDVGELMIVARAIVRVLARFWGEA